MKKYLGNRISSLKENRFSKVQLAVFVLVFASIGSYLLISSHAAPAPKANPHAGLNEIGALIFEKQELHLASGDVAHHKGRQPLLLPKLKNIAQQRKMQVLNLFKTDPHTARSVVLAGSDASTLKSLGVDVEQPVTLNGQMGVLQLDDSTGDHFYYQLVTPGHKTYYLDTEQAIPRVKPGSNIQVSGLALDNQLLVNLSKDANPYYSPLSAGSDPSVSFADDGTAPIVTTSTDTTGSTFTTTGNIKDAIMIGNFAGGSTPVTLSQVQNIYSNNPGADVASFLHANSEGKATLAPTYFGPFSIPSVSCGNGSAEGQALESAAAATGATMANYEVHTYITNCNEGEYASDAGTADIRYNYISSYGLTNIHGPAHELSHTMDAAWMMLGHGGYLDCAPQIFSPPVNSSFDTGACQVAEYQDPYDVLGGGESGTTGYFGAPHKIDSGWLDSTQYETVTTPGTTSYTLSPTEGNSGLVALKIPRGNSGSYLTVEFRQPLGFESFISGSSCPYCNANMGALVRIGGITYSGVGGGADSNIIDMTPGSHPDVSSYWPANDGDDGTLLPGQTFTDSEYGIGIKTVSASSSALAVQVTLGTAVCNYAAPTVSPVSPSSFTVAPGQSVSYSFTVTNNDSAGCKPDAFKFYPRSSSGLNGIGIIAKPDYFTLDPGTSTTVTVQASTPASITDNYYTAGGQVISRPFGIAAVNVQGPTLQVISAADTTPPTAPTNPKVMILGSAAVKLSWGSSADNLGVAGYRINVMGGAQYSTTSTTYTILGLLPSTTYSFTIQAYDHKNNISSPLTVSVTTPVSTLTPPSPPGVPNFSVSDHSYTINWSPAYDPSGVACYLFFYIGASVVCNISGTSTTINNVPSETTFNKVGILAYDGDGNLTFSDERNITTNVEGDTSGPSEPQQLYAAYHSSSGTMLSWQPSTDVRPITGYYIYRGCCKVAFTSNTSSYLDPTNASANYRVQAEDSDGNLSPTSNDIWTAFGGAQSSDTTPPTATMSSPAGSSVVSGTISLQTTASDNVGVTGVSYLLDGHYSLGNGSSTSPYTLNVNTTNYADGPHWITAQVKDASDNMGSSPPISVTFNNYGNTQPPDTTPPTVSITAPTNGSTVSGTVSVTATATDNTAVSHVDFLVDGVLKVSDTTSPYSYSLNTSALTNGSHVITTNAYDPSNNESSASSTINVANGDTTPPSAPTTLTATAPAYNQVSLVWTASADNVGVAGYYVVRNGTTIAKTAGTSTAYTDNSVSASTAYTYQVMAYDAAGNTSNLSNSASITTPSAPDTSPPTSPSNLTATAVSSSQINLSWGASTDNIGVTAYDIYRGSTKITSVSGSVTSYGDTGLAANTTYSYYVRARDAAGNTSSASNTASATTQPVVQPTTGSLSGTVTSNASASGIAGALVSLSTGGKHGTKANTSTAASGSYSMTNLTPASYSASYSAQGYNSQKLSLTITAGTNTQDVGLNLCTSRRCK